MAGPAPGQTRKRRKPRAPRGRQDVKIPKRRFPGHLPKPLTTLGGKIALAAVAAVVTATVGAAFKAWVIDRPDSLPRQLGAIQAEQERQGRQVFTQERTSIHDDVQSYFFIFKDEELGRQQFAPGDPGQDSDLVRIYDYTPAGLFQRRELEERFSFRPRGRANQFILDSIKDWDSSGRSKVVMGSFQRLSEDTSASVPVYIRWDPNRGRYRMVSILSRRDLLPRIPDDTYRYAYTTRYSLVDRTTRATVRGYGVELPTVMKVRGEPILVGGYVAERPDFVPTALRVHAWSLDFRRSPPDIRSCTFLTAGGPPYEEGLTVDLQRTSSAGEAMRQAVTERADDLAC